MKELPRRRQRKRSIIQVAAAGSRDGMGFCGRCADGCCTAPLARSSESIFDRFLLNASLLTKDPAKFQRPCTGALVRDVGK